MENEVIKKDTWDRRRFRMDLVCVFLAACIGYILYQDVNSTSLFVFVTSLVSMVSVYVFGAVWEHNSYMTNVAKLK